MHLRNPSLSAFTCTALLALLSALPAIAQDAAAPPAAPAPDAAVAPPAAPAPDAAVAAPAGAAPPATTANGPGPATAPPPPPGTAVPAPTQAPAAPTPPGTATGSETPAPAAPAAPPPNYNIQTSGLIDGYYMLDLRNTGSNLIQGTGRSYDQRTKTPTLALAELNVFKNPKPANFGFKATLIAGDTADINHGNFNPANGSTVGNTGEAQFKNVQQLYGTYAFAGGGGVDFGKFYTPLGYEVTEANGNYNYSRSLPYYILPVYHAGARIYTPSMNGLTATAYITNNLFNSATGGVHDDNSKKAFIGQINFTDPAGKFVFIATYGFAKKEDALTSINATEKTDGTAADVDFTYNLTANKILAANYTYVKYSGNGNADAKTNGYAVYYRQALTPKTAFALRFSGLDADTYTVDPATNTTAGGGKPKEVTLTYELKPTTAFTTRLEYRHDFSNQQVFASNKNGDTSKNQDTLTLAGMFTF